MCSIDDGNGAFGGADAVEGFRIIGAGFTGTVEAELDDAGYDGMCGAGCCAGGHPGVRTGWIHAG